MTSPLKDFGKTAQGLSRNPLGIIALFIVLVYGIAGLVLASSSGDLQAIERLPLVGFLVVFPVIVLIVFYFLVTRHHTKLYAPKDFPDPEDFIRVMTPAEQRENLEREIEETSSGVELEIRKEQEQETVAAATEDEAAVTTADLRSDWVLAEELAIREVQIEFGARVHRQVVVGPHYAYDGVFLRGGKLTVLEIKYTRRLNWSTTVKRAIEHLNRAAENVQPARAAVLVIVTDGIPPEWRQREAEEARELLKSSPMPIELLTYDFMDLKQKYGLVGDST
jgi:hypothetical protein